MSEALAVYTPEIVEKSIVITRPPDAVLNEAHKAAAALAAVINGKAKPVRFNGETYLEFEDWQTVARFYGISTKIVSTTPVTFGDVHGWEAKAEAIHNGSGQVVSAADSMCLNDEPNWKSKPQFMLRSMAQTRACAKALRNVLAWVVVLAGYKPTPAEEMDGVQGFSVPTPNDKPKTTAKPASKPATEKTPLDKLKDKIWARSHEAKLTTAEVKSYSTNVIGKERSAEWTEQDCDSILLWIEDTAAARAQQELA